MPRSKRSNLANSSRTARRLAHKRIIEIPENRNIRLAVHRAIVSTSRGNETSQQRHIRTTNVRVRTALRRDAETPEERTVRNEVNRSRQAQSRTRSTLTNAAFHYDKDYDYRLDENILIGQMDILCIHCRALKFRKETTGMCCINGKIHLPLLLEPPEPLLTYVTGATQESKHFLQHIPKYNSCFSMTSFGATNIVRYGNFMPTFKVQEQVYHRIGSLLPIPEQNPQFLQIYFMDNVEQEINQRCKISVATERQIMVEEEM